VFDVVSYTSENKGHVDVNCEYQSGLLSLRSQGEITGYRKKDIEYILLVKIQTHFKSVSRDSKNYQLLQEFQEHVSRVTDEAALHSDYRTLQGRDHYYILDKCEADSESKLKATSFFQKDDGCLDPRHVIRQMATRFGVKVDH